MSRTYKDAPYRIWLCRRLGKPVPANWRHYADWRNSPRPGTAAYEGWHDVLPDDPAVGYNGRLHNTNTAWNDADVQRRYRSYVRDMIHHGRWDDIEPIRHLTGYDWWW